MLGRKGSGFALAFGFILKTVATEMRYVVGGRELGKKHRLRDGAAVFAFAIAVAAPAREDELVSSCSYCRLPRYI